MGTHEGEVGVLVSRKTARRVTQMEKTQLSGTALKWLAQRHSKELGEEEDGNEITELEERIKETRRDECAALKPELKKLKPLAHAEVTQQWFCNYAPDLPLAVPLSKKSRTKKDLSKAEEILNADHYGLEKAGERILEYLAVQQRLKKLRRPDIVLGRPTRCRQLPWASPLRGRLDANLSACRSAVCAMK